MLGMQPLFAVILIPYHEVIPLASPEITCTDRREPTKNEENWRRYEKDEGRASGAWDLTGGESNYALLAPVIILTTGTSGAAVVKASQSAAQSYREKISRCPG